MRSTKAYFSPAFFRFIKDLKRNNNRDWFLANKERYEKDVRGPALEFITDIAAPLKAISRRMVADPKPHGGSLFRIYRDTRFSEDKTPYKTHTGIHFRHEKATKDVHGPSFYVHLAPGEVFIAGGIWHPDNTALTRIRQHIVDNTRVWNAIKSSGLELEGSRLSRPPKGFRSDHPNIEDLKFTDFITSAEFTEKEACRTDFMDRSVESMKKISPLMKFLCSAFGLRF